MFIAYPITFKEDLAAVELDIDGGGWEPASRLFEEDKLVPALVAFKRDETINSKLSFNLGMANLKLGLYGSALRIS